MDAPLTLTPRELEAVTGGLFRFPRIAAWFRSWSAARDRRLLDEEFGTPWDHQYRR